MNRVVGPEEGKRSAARGVEKDRRHTKMRGSYATHSIVKGISILPKEVYPGLLRG